MPSAARWNIVVSPPRDHPMAWSPGSPAGAPFLRDPARVLLSSHDRGVHGHNPRQALIGVGLGHQRGEHPLPGAIDGPHPQTVADGPPVAVLLTQMDPLRSGLELEGYRVDHLTVIPPTATPLRRPDLE